MIDSAHRPAPGLPEIRPLSSTDPFEIGPYALLGRLGAGAMGRVYLGSSATGRLVAVKTIKGEYAEEPDFRLRFTHEITAVQRVSGFFTAGVVASDPEAEEPWLATAYVPAPTLEQLVGACGPLPVPAIRWLAVGCAEALESVHQAGLVHRDLKPSNVLVCPDGPRVIDFGLARLVERTGMTATRATVGTPAFMAPEQARGARHTSPAGDVYSLGSTLVFAATGHPPYQGENVVEILTRLTTRRPDLTGLPAELADLVSRCMQREPEDRITPAALVAALEHHPEIADATPGRPASCLPPAAVALIERYGHGPHLPEDVSHGAVRPEAPGRAERPGRRGRTGMAEPPRPSAAAPGRPEAGRGSARRPRRLLTVRPGDPSGVPVSFAGTVHQHRVASGVISIGVVTALVTLGGIVGATLGTGQSTPQGDRTGATQAVAPAGLPPAPLSGQYDRPTGDPRIVVNQPLGDGNTVFVVHGTGYSPGQQVTLSLSGAGASPDRPTTDMKGTFNYAVNQGHEFFPGALPPGHYEVTATAPGGTKTTAVFTVHP